MEDVLSKKKSMLKPILGALILLGLIILVSRCVANDREAKRQAEAIATAEGFATIISETLKNETQLTVQRARGQVRVRAVNQGDFWRTSQTSRMPYTAQYSVDLSRVGLSQVRYDEANRTLLVELPDIVVSPPNIDESKKVILERTGRWTSRDAAENLAARSSKLAVAGATASVNQPAKIERARANARLMVDELLELPLRASGRDEINVVIRFPADGGPLKERWDVSPSIEQVLARRNAE